MPRFDVLVTLKLDGGDLTYSVSGLQGTDGYYWPRVLEISQISQELSLVPDDFRVSEVTVTLDNSDRELSALRAAKAFRNRLMTVRMGDAAAGADSFDIVFEGRISGWSADTATFSVTASNTFQTIFERPVTPEYVVTRQNFTSAPDDSITQLTPLVVGRLDSDEWSGQGALVPVQIQTSPWKAVACQGTNTMFNHIRRVWVSSDEGEGQFQGLALDRWTQAAELIDGQYYRTLTIPNKSDTENKEVRVDLIGIIDAGGWSQNPLRNLRIFLTRNGVKDTDFDEPSIRAAEMSLNTQGIRSPVWCIEREQLVRNVVDDVARSTNVTLYLSKEGKIAATVPHPGRVAQASASIGLDRIIKDTFDMSGADEAASVIDYTYRYVPATGNFEAHGSRPDSVQKLRLGEDVRVDHQMPFLQEEISAARVATVRAFFLQEQRIQVSFDADPELYTQLSVGQDIKLTHDAGTGAGGFQDRLFRIIGLSLKVSDQAITSGFRLVDVSEDTGFSLTSEWKGTARGVGSTTEADTRSVDISSGSSGL